MNKELQLQIQKLENDLRKAEQNYWQLYDEKRSLWNKLQLRSWTLEIKKLKKEIEQLKNN